MNYNSVVIVDEEAVEIGDLYRRARGSFVDSVRCLIEAGHRLTAKKDSLPHGQWLPWLRDNADTLGFGQNAAQKLMAAATKYVVDYVFGEAEAVQISRLIWGNGGASHRTDFTGNYESYTPAEYVERARRVLGVIDLDPASSALAQETVKATRYFDEEDDGLGQEWQGSVWLNPPYSQPAIEQFIDKLIEETAAGRTTQAILLTHNSSDTAWFHKAANSAAAFCSTRGRISFVDTEGQRDAPKQGQMFFYFGPNIQPFRAEFSDVGTIVKAL